MSDDGIMWLVNLPVPCPKCGKEGLQNIARLETGDAVKCPHCRSMIDVSTEEWRAVIEKFSKLCRSTRLPGTQG